MPNVILVKRPGGTGVGDALGGLAQVVANVFERRRIDRERAQKEADHKAARERENLDMELALRQAAIQEAGIPTPGDRPVDVATPTPVRTGGALSQLIGGPPSTQPDRREMVDVVRPGPEPMQYGTIPAISYRGQEVLPERKIPRRYAGEVLRETWKTDREKRLAALEPIQFPNDPSVPDVYRGRTFNPGDPMYVLAEAARPKYAEALFREPKKPEKKSESEDFLYSKYGDNPTPEQRLVGRRLWEASGRAPERPEKPTYSWVTDKKGGRVRILDSTLDAAPPGTYSDVKPAQPRVIMSGQAVQARAAASKLLGTEKETKGDSIWALSNRIFTIPAWGGLMGPTAKAIGVGTRLGVWSGINQDAELYKSQIEGYVPLFARGVGHSGTLTEKDVVRTEKLFGEFGNTKELVRRKMRRLERIMRGDEPLPPGLFDVQPGVWPLSDDGAPAGGETTVGRDNIGSLKIEGPMMVVEEQ